MVAFATRDAYAHFTGEREYVTLSYQPMADTLTSEPLLVAEGENLDTENARININKLPKFRTNGKGAEISWRVCVSTARCSHHFSSPSYNCV
jgi:hypothetical protein